MSEEMSVGHHVEHICSDTTHRIVSSGYSDRYIAENTIITMSIETVLGDGTTIDYTLRFDRWDDAYSYLRAAHGMSSEEATAKIKGAAKYDWMEWERLGVRSLAKNINIASIQQVLNILNDSVKQEVREQRARDIMLTAGEYYAICTWLYRCNESNRLMARRGLRNGVPVIVQPPGFELDSEFDEGRVRDTLLALAADPSQCYSIPE